jgi:multiple sugar transport system permease protein
MSRRTAREWVAGAPFVFPATVIVLLFSFAAIAYSFWVSLHNWDILIPEHPYVGFDNYREVLFGRDTIFWIALGNTLYYVVLLVPSVLVTAFALSLLAYKAPYGQSFFKTAFFLPSVTPVVVISLIWMWLYRFDGPVNHALGLAYSGLNPLMHVFGLAPLSPPNWLTDKSTAMPAIVIMSTWQAAGYYSVVFLAGLSEIPREFYEAAHVDGAGALKSLWYITLPLLRNTFVFVSVMLVIGGFQVFTQVYIMTRGGPGTATEVMTSAVFKRAFQSYGAMGTAAAMAWLMFAIVFVFVLVYMRLVRSRRLYD